MTLKNYKELIVWQRSMELVFEIYLITKQMPNEEKFGLCSQMQRAAVAIPSNIAEGAGRSHSKEFMQFLGISFGSSAELETQILISKKLYNFINFDRAEVLNTEVQKMLNGLLKKLNSTSH